MRQNKFQAPAAACSRSSSSSFTAHPSLCSVCRDRRRSHLKIHTKAGKDAPLCQKIGSFPTLPLFLLFFVTKIADLAGLIPPIFPLLLLQPGTPFAYFAPIPLPQNVRACRRGRSHAKEDWPTPPASFFTLLRSRNCGSGRAYSANLSPAAFAAGDPVCLFCANPIAAKRARLPARALTRQRRLARSSCLFFYSSS